MQSNWHEELKSVSSPHRVLAKGWVLRLVTRPNQHVDKPHLGQAARFLPGTGRLGGELNFHLTWCVTNANHGLSLTLRLFRRRATSCLGIGKARKPALSLARFFAFSAAQSGAPGSCSQMSTSGDVRKTAGEETNQSAAKHSSTTSHRTLLKFLCRMESVWSMSFQIIPCRTCSR